MVTHERALAEQYATHCHALRRSHFPRGASAMKARDLTELAARNLREAVLRNSLTTLGIAVGVASLVAVAVARRWPANNWWIAR